MSKSDILELLRDKYSMADIIEMLDPYITMDDFLDCMQPLIDEHYYEAFEDDIRDYHD